jgi:arginyl-tRNA---protein transferase
MTEVQICGYSRHNCGYCGLEGSVSYGVVCTQLTVEQYETMMLRGWRRSGTYLYKPTNHVTCCPAYTIRLNVADFKPNKKQRQVLRKVERYLMNGDVHEIPATTKTAEKTNSEKTSENNEKRTNGKDEMDPLSLDRPGSTKQLHTLTIQSQKAQFTPEVYNLYVKLSEKTFTRFLVESPLIMKSSGGQKGDQEKIAYGSYHHLYRLSDQLIAVGVVDLLPSGLSSVYLFYDPSYRDLVLGKYTAMKEIEFCKKNSLPYYYMGFYIHNCEKMKYKSDFSPSELLCSTTLTWHPYTACTPLLNKPYVFTPFDTKYSQLRGNIGPIASDKSILAKDEGISEDKENEAHTKGRDQLKKDDKKEQEKEEDSSDVDIDKLLATHELRAFAPRFTGDGSPLAFENVPLLLYERQVRMNMLSGDGPKIVRKLINDLVDNIGHAFLAGLQLRLA